MLGLETALWAFFRLYAIIAENGMNTGIDGLFRTARYPLSIKIRSDTDSNPSPSRANPQDRAPKHQAARKPAKNQRQLITDTDAF